MISDVWSIIEILTYSGLVNLTISLIIAIPIAALFNLQQIAYTAKKAAEGVAVYASKVLIVLGIITILLYAIIWALGEKPMESDYNIVRNAAYLISEVMKKVCFIEQDRLGKSITVEHLPPWFFD